MTELTEDEIMALAEVRANGTAEGDVPTDEEFAQAEEEVREMLADGMRYDPEKGWLPPATNDEDDEDDEDDELDDFEFVPPHDIKLNGRCEVTLHLSVHDVSTLSEALNITATSLGRYGIDPFYIVATDPDTDQQWIVNGDHVLREKGQDDSA